MRLHFLLTMPAHLLTHDEAYYNAMVQNFLTQGYLGYKDTVANAFVTPGYPLFLTGVYLLADLLNADRLFLVRLMQVFLSTGVVYITFLIAQRAVGTGTAITATVIAAFYPPFIWANTRILTEILFSFLICLYIYLVLVNLEKRALFPHAVTGAILALAVLVRPAAAPIIVVPYLLTFFKTKDTNVFLQFISASAGFCLVMLPWWIRNYVVLKEFIIFATQTGNPLLRGADPYDPYDNIGSSVIKGIPPEDQTRVAIERIKHGLKNDPLLWISWYTVGKFWWLWARPWGYVNYLINTGLILHGLIIILSFLGSVLCTKKLSFRWLIAVPVFFTLVQLAFVPLNRYMFPIMPVMIILACAGVTAIFSRFYMDNLS